MSMPDHPLHQKLKDPTKNRLKRKSLNHLVKEQQKEHADILTTDGHLCEKTDFKQLATRNPTC